MKLLAKKASHFAFIEKFMVDSDQKFQSSSFRGCSLSYTLRRIWPLCGRLGITRISEIGELDNIGLPVVSALRPNVNEAQITTAQGKGVTLKAALVSAIMEAIERYSAANYTSSLETASQIDLQKNRRNFLSLEVIGGAAKNEDPCEWLTGYAIHDNKPILLPASDVLFPFYPKCSSVRPFRPSTTGLASGNSILEAILSSINEVVERDAVSKFVKSQHAGLVDIKSISNSEIIYLIDKIRNANVDILILDISNHSALPTYYVSLLSNHPGLLNIACAGQGTHICPEVALKRALLESVQSRSVAIQGGREDLIRHATEWNGKFDYFKSARESLKLMANNSIGKVKLPYSGRCYYSIIQLLSDTLQCLQVQGFHEFYMTNLTNEKISIPTVHLIIPGLVDNVVDPNRKHSFRVIGKQNAV